MKLYRDAKTWPRQGKSKSVLEGPSVPGKPTRMVTFDGYSYLQSVASLLVDHRERQTSMALTTEQLKALEDIPWMQDYRAHLATFHKKYGSREKHPSSQQKIEMLKRIAEKPAKDTRITVTDNTILPHGVDKYEFDPRRFMDAISNNWRAARGIEVKKVPIQLSDRQMRELEAVPWFYDFVSSLLRKDKKLRFGEPLRPELDYENCELHQKAIAHVLSLPMPRPMLVLEPTCGGKRERDCYGAADRSVERSACARKLF